MTKLSIIVGVAGSGKSTLCEEIARGRSIKVFGDATLVNSERRRAGFDCLGELVARLLSGEDCVMDESHLTLPHFRDLFKQFCDEFLGRAEQEWLFFERNPLACINNVYHDMYVPRTVRDLPSRLKALQGQVNGYQVPPPGSFPGHQSPRSVYRQPSPRFTDEAAAIAWLSDEVARLD